jgi:hypothetical protein
MAKFEIQFNEVPHDQPVQTYVRDRLQGWLKERLGKLKKQANPDVKIEFFQAPFEKKISCYIEIRKGNLVWRSFEYGRGVHNTFLACLKQLSENTMLERSAQPSVSASFV